MTNYPSNTPYHAAQITIRPTFRLTVCRISAGTRREMTVELFLTTCMLAELASIVGIVLRSF